MSDEYIELSVAHAANSDSGVAFERRDGVLLIYPTARKGQARIVRCGYALTVSDTPEQIDAVIEALTLLRNT